MPPHRSRSGLGRFWSDRSGSTGMMFGLLVIPIAAAVGLAVDFGRVYAVNSHTQSALDAAALAAGRVSQVEKVNTVQKASAAADAYFSATKPKNVIKSTLEFSPNELNTEFKVTATSWVRTPFLGIINSIIPRDSEAGAPADCQGNFYACIRVVTTATAALCPSSACSVGGGGGGENSKGESVEIALMLDVTGSMKGQKLADLKASAKDLVNIVIWDDQSKYTSKVALAPFAAAVNVGSAYFKKITNKSDAEDTDKDGDPDGDGYNYPATCYRSNGKLKDSCSDNKEDYRAYATCVVERTGTNAATDAVPAGSSTYLPAWNDAANKTSTSSANPPAKAEQRCSPKSKIVPLTSNRTTLTDAIDAMEDGGSTAGQLGTAFAWYLLSPKWENVWPSTSKPAAYGTSKLRKIAVLMTDGEYNTLQGKQYSDGSDQADTALDRAKQICAAMKKNSSSSDPNIEIFTVGFQLDSKAAKSMLKSCATSDDHNYTAETGDQLKQAFRDIALKIAWLRLTN